MKNFLPYVKAKIGERSEELAFRVYASDALKGIFKAVGGEMTLRYYDIIEPKKAETRTPDEIVEGIRKKLRR